MRRCARRSSPVVTGVGVRLRTEPSRALSNRAWRFSLETGVVGAVMNVLRESGPLKTEELFDAVKERYPGAAAKLEKSGRHLIATRGGHELHRRKKGASPAIVGLENVCDYPLRNQLMKSRSRSKSESQKPGYSGKDMWAVRRKGQVRRWHARSHKFNPGRGRIYGHHA